MAQVLASTLTLTPFVDTDGLAKVDIQVTYNAVFSASERNLTTAPFEWRFHEIIQVVGVDIPFVNPQILVDKILPIQEIPVTPGGTPLTVPRTRTARVLRSLLQEDPAPGDADEIRCNIQILPVAASGLSPQANLAG